MKTQSHPMHPQSTDTLSREGLVLAFSAYLTWGVVPVFFKWLDHVPPFELVAHRLIWSLILLMGLLTVSRRWTDMRISWRQFGILTATALLLSANWLLFIWAIVNNNITETSLGYYINPLVNVLLGTIFLGERLRPLQWISLLIAAAGITWQLLVYGQVPWIALTLAACFGLYGLLRKQLNMPSFAGLTLECLILLPVAVVYLLWLSAGNHLSMGQMGLTTDLLLVASGLVTAVPLLCFAAAVTRLPLTIMGLLQYIAPSVSLLLAIFLYDEAFGIQRLITFTCIWTALILFAGESFLH
ncbi:MAG: EamA family transporter RarD, partial [Gammaproteobacteria bacterium]|nr:EamA family transporter RarD [Gammaproteobacteria bacterium]